MQGFFFRERKTPTSKAQRGYRGSISLISPVFGNLKQCLYIINRVLLKSIPFEVFSIIFVILPMELSSFVNKSLVSHKAYKTYMSKSEWIFSRQTYPMHYDYSSKTNKFYIQIVLNKSRKLKHEHSR